MISCVFPFLLLITAIGSIFLYQRSENEIYRILAASLALVCIVWGFAVAHWSIHLVFLLFLLKPNLFAFLRETSANSEA